VKYLIKEKGGGPQHQESSLPPAAAPSTLMSTPTITPAATPKPVEFATPRTVNLTLNVDHDDGLVARYRRMKDLLGRGEPPGLAACQLEEEVTE